MIQAVEIIVIPWMEHSDFSRALSFHSALGGHEGVGEGVANTILKKKRLQALNSEKLNVCQGQYAHYWKIAAYAVEHFTFVFV